ncbi:g12708 [Coccomyxa viridis]|uniref:G12708 protein n=1 Tax=Coccomyxa viridis TaxID=1274662 RepID=A0ABP1GDL4_9CHLO
MGETDPTKNSVEKPVDAEGGVCIEDFRGDSATDNIARQAVIKDIVDTEQKEEPTNWKGFLKKGWSGNGGSLSDAWLTSACAQIGQVMLALPHAISLMGLRAACVIIPCYTLFSMWTMHLLTTLFVEYKARKVKEGKWVAGRAVQYYDVAGYLVGRPAGAFTLFITVVSLVSTSIAQIIATSTGFYYIVTGVNKLYWALVWGGILTFLFSLIPSFRHFRIFNIIGLVGTAYTAVFIIASAAKTGLQGKAFYLGPKSLQNYFLGTNIAQNAWGGHTMSFEVIDAMYKPSRYDSIYPLSYIFTYVVTVPHSILTQLAWPLGNAKQGNVFGVVPNNAARDVSIILMVIHECIAYAIYITPVFFMWEKLIGTHYKPNWIRLPSRLPVAFVVWLIALLFPFYDTINAIMGAFGNGFTAFVFPAAYHMWVYRTPEARAACLKPPPRWIGGWTGAFVLNALIASYFLIFGVGFGIWAALANLISNVHQYSVFAKCYQCADIVRTNQLNG